MIMTTVQAFHPVPAPTDSNDADTPTTPRLHPMNQPHALQHIQTQTPKEEESARTPTTASFAEANGKRALPLSPPPPAHASLAKHVVSDAVSEDGKRPVSQRSNRSLESDEMHGTASHTSPENEGSDVESGDDDGRPAKKKKGQRFFCTDYPPCNLSFTRSEHLARHIRKHTGERPFQCHCNRRFSRLDNLRQHAQTVHVNEEIPTDSLAATGTRFQRQIRTDRVRPAGARSRASTTGSSTPHARGHSRNLSTSSIASTASNMSTLSTLSQDPRMHPHPLMMAPEQRPPGGLTIDTHRASPQFAYGTPSNAPSTPTSTNYSTNPGSPYSNYSSITSPVSSSRYPSYDGGSRHARRLSVPNGPHPYNLTYPATPMPPSPSSQQYTVTNTSTVASPTGSVFSGRQDLTPSEAELRRRTWHPSTYSGYSYQRPATSGLSYSQTPDAPQPAFAPQAASAASQPVTLPGFRDLVNTINRPATPPNQVSGQQPPTESPGRPQLVSSGSSSDRNGGPHPADRPAHRSWDVSLHQNLNKLDITNSTPPRESGWGQQTMSDINHAASSVQAPTSAHAQPPQPTQPQQQMPQHPQQQAQQPPLLGPMIHPAPMEIEPESPTRSRRQGWYQGPIAPASHATVVQQQRISPASSTSESIPTPNTSSFEHQPTILHTNGHVEPARPLFQQGQQKPQEQLPPQYIQTHYQHQQPPPPHQQQQQQQQKPPPPPPQQQLAPTTQQQHMHSSPYAPTDPKQPEQPAMSGLEALVAVATSESQSREGHR